MKINEEELLSLAIAGTAGECNFWKDMDDKEKLRFVQRAGEEVIPGIAQGIL